MTTATAYNLPIVYAGPIEEWNTCYSRLMALREIESKVSVFDTCPYFKGCPNTFLQKIARKFSFSGRSYAQANSDFLALCQREQPKIVWIDKGDWLWPSTLRSLRSSGAFLAQHCTDALNPCHWGTWLVMRLLRQTLPFYDLYFTSNLNDYAALRGRRDPHAELTFLGFDHRRLNHEPLSPELAAKWSNDLLFVGHYEPHTEAGILALKDAGLQVSVYGRTWNRAAQKRRLRGIVDCRQLDLPEYHYALKGAKIGLGFISKWNCNQTAGRSFEIPASGTFLLAMRSQQHLDCYKEGEEAEFFDNTNELVQKAKRYLTHETERQQIARRGHDRCVASDYSWARYMRDDWAKTKAHYEAFRDKR